MKIICNVGISAKNRKWVHILCFAGPRQMMWQVRSGPVRSGPVQSLGLEIDTQSTPKP